MAITLTINAKDSTGNVLREVAVELNEAAKGADKVSAAGKRMGASMRSAADDAKKAGDATAGLANSSRITAMASAFSAVSIALRGVSQAARSAAATIAEFAEQGRPEFVRMNETIKQTTSAWTDLKGTILTAKFGSGESPLEAMLNNASFLMAKLKGLTTEQQAAIQGMAAASKTLSEIDRAAAQQAQANAASQLQSLNDVQAKITDQRAMIEELGRTANLTDAQRQENAQKLIGLMNQEQALLRQRQAFERVAFDYVKSRTQEEQDAKLQEIKGLSEVNQKIDEQLNLIQNLAEADGTTADQMESERNKLLKLDQRRKEIIREIGDAEKKAAEEAKRSANEVADAKARAEEREREEIRKTTEEADRARRKRIDDIAQKAGSGQSLGDAKQQEVDLVKKTNEQILQLREQATQSYVSGDVKGFMQARQQEAQILQQAMQQQKEIREKFGKEGKSLDKIKAGISQEDVVKQIQQNSGQTRRQVMNDFRTGKRGEVDVTKATNELVEQTINSAQEQGKLGEEQVAGLRQALQNEKQLMEQVRQQAEETKSLNESLRSVQEELGTLRSDGRSRAMRR